MKLLVSAFVAPLLASASLDLPAPRIVSDGDEVTAILFEKPATLEGQNKLNAAFLQTMKQFEDEWQVHAHQHDSFLQLTEGDKYSGYQHKPVKPVCEINAPNALAMRAKSAKLTPFPGGILGDVLNFNLAKLVDQLAQKASTSAASSGGLGGIIAMQGIMMASSLIQGIVASAIHIIPPMIPPPVWNNQPLACLPMLTGHNCFGAILHPITVSDFIMASSTDMMMSGYIASFPQTYADKVGFTPDSLYKACFSAYMSMNCGSIFPKCLAPQTGNDPTALSPQRVPLCFMYCIGTLVACPGFWIDDIIGACEEISVPVACSTSFFWRLDLLPPQYVSLEAAMPTEEECPTESYDVAAAPESAAALASAAGAEGPAVGEVGGIPGLTDTVKLPSPA